VLSETKQQLLRRRLRGEGANAPIPRADRSKPLPLSFGQQRLWFLEQLEPGQCQYNVPAPLRLTGTVDHRAIEGALSSVVERHEVLRTRLASASGVGRQIIDPPAPVTVDVVDLSDEPDPMAAAAHALAEDDFATAQMMYAQVLQQDAGNVQA
jgi:hypothetical protein